MLTASLGYLFMLPYNVMEQPTVYKVKDKRGRFVKKKEKTISLSVCVLPADHKKLISLIPEGGTMSDVLREAIAQYLKSKEGDE